jgi:hypothetical protein
MSKEHSGHEVDKQRPMGKGTLTLETKRLELEQKRLEMQALDKERDDRRAYIRTVIAGGVSTLALVLIGFALYWNRAFVFRGFGIEATTGSTAHHITSTPADN